MIAWLRAAFAALLTFATTVGPTHAGNQAETGGLPVPRFVSIKADRVNVRGGPDKDHDVSFIFTRVGWPVEITAEFENWRRIRDSDGSEGWVYHSLLSGKRTAAIEMKDKNGLALLHEAPETRSPVMAKLEEGVLGTVTACNGIWCHLVGKNFDGWVEQDDLWGVYPNEKID
ncbi:MAG: SH3 domain-containing protein [Xanthobacteraceae bacterium]